jgi:hypothetical protein
MECQSDKGFPDEISLLDAVTEMLNKTSTDGLQRVFGSWIERVETAITADWGSASWQMSFMLLFDVSSSALWLVSFFTGPPIEFVTGQDKLPKQMFRIRNQLKGNRSQLFDLFQW